MIFNYHFGNRDEIDIIKDDYCELLVRLYNFGPSGRELESAERLNQEFAVY